MRFETNSRAFVRKLLVGASTLPGLLAGSTVVSAAAQETATVSADTAQVRFNLPSGPLQDTLTRIEQLSGQRVVFTKSNVSAYRSSPVVGNMSAARAVAAAVAGTGLTVTQQADGSIVVGVLSAAPGEIVVTGLRDEAETGFKVSRSETATRSGASLLETPGSVTVVTAKVLETQQSLSLIDAMNNVSGLAIDQSNQGPATVFTRGFGSTSLTTNGINDPSATTMNVFAVERVEVLKGPQAILSGADSFGGGVNIVTKKPQAQARQSILLQYGSYGDLTAAADVTGKITEDSKLSFRVIGSAANADDSPGGFDGRRDYSVLPQLRYNDKGTDLIVGYSWGKQYTPLPQYTLARRDGTIAPVPSMRLGNIDDGFRSNQSRVFYQFEQALGSHVTLISRLQYAESHVGMRTFGSSGLLYDRGAPNDRPNGRVNFYGNVSSIDDRSFGGDHYLRITGKTGPLQHALSVGMNHTSLKSTQRMYDAAFVSGTLYPTPSNYDFPSLNPAGTSPYMIFATKTTQLAAYAQDLVSWGPVNLLLNLRTTRYTSESTTQFDFGDEIEKVADPKKTKTKTTPGLGATVKITPSFSVYASYAEGFAPQFMNSCSGGRVDPTLTRNREIGAKLDLFGGNLSMTGSAFKLALSNQLSYNGQSDCYDSLNGQVTRGLEFDMQGQILPGWSIIANYTYSDPKDKSDPTRIFAGLPSHKGNLWTTYTLQSGRLKGLGAGFGVTATSRFDGSRIKAYPYRVPTQARVDLSLFYEREGFSATLGVKNLFDDLLYATPTTAIYVPLQTGRTVMLTLKSTFQ